MYMIFLLFACFERKPQSDEDCATFRDKCNSGCELICGSIDEKEKIENGDICDLGCMDSGALDVSDCILVDEVCQFAE